MDEQRVAVVLAGQTQGVHDGVVGQTAVSGRGWREWKEGVGVGMD